MTGKTEVTTRVFIFTPQVPNYLRTEFDKFPVGRFSDETLIGIAEQWKDELLQKAGIQRKNSFLDV